MALRKINLKKPILTRDVVIAVVIFSGIISLMVLGIAGISDEYDSNLIIDEGFSEKYDKLTELTAGIETTRASAADPGGLSFLGTFDVAFQSTFTVIQMVFNSLSIIGQLPGSFAEDFGFDPTVVNVVFLIGLSILTVIIVFVWISSISRGKI